MKIFIIFLNFLLITLILHSLFSCKIVEGLSECENKNSAIEKNKALLDSMFSSMNKLELEQKQQTVNIDKNKSEIQKNNLLARSVVSDMENQKKQKEQTANINTNKMRIQQNNLLARSVVSDMESQKKEKEKELDDLEKGGDNYEKVNMNGSIGGGGFSSKLRNSQGSARI